MFKRFFKYFVWYNFWLQIQIIRFFKKPYIILIVGGTKKTLIRKKFFDLSKKNNLNYNRSFRPYNTWFGVGLNFLDLPSAFSDYKKWLLIYILSWVKFFKHLISFPQYIYLEGGIDSKGEAKKFIFLLKPDIIYFCEIDSIFQDDFDMQNILEKEFLNFVEYLNKNSEKLSLIDQKMSLEEFFDKYILNKSKYIGVFESDSGKYKILADKLIRKVYIIK